MMAGSLLSLLDTVFVGWLCGSILLALLGISTSIFHLIFNMFCATTSDTTSLVAGLLITQDNISNKHVQTSNITTIPEIIDDDNAGLVTSTSIKLDLTIRMFLATALLLLWRYHFECHGRTKNSSSYSSTSYYLCICAFAAPAVFSTNVAKNSFRGYTDTAIPLFASGVTALCNLALDASLAHPQNLD